MLSGSLLEKTITALESAWKGVLTPQEILETWDGDPEGHPCEVPHRVQGSWAEWAAVGEEKTRNWPVQKNPVGRVQYLDNAKGSLST